MSEAENPEGRPEAAGADAQVKPQNPEAEGAEPKVEAEKKVPLPLRKLHEVRQKAFGCDIEGTAVADHSLPYRVLIEELHHRGKADEDDFRDLVAKNEKDYEALAKLKDALMPLDPLKDWDASQKALKAAKDKLSECNENDGRLKKVLHDADTFALCFSGGGIRSASVCLGVLQGLSRNVKQMVKGVDYLSTVSGGGYIGSWLMAWSRREQHGFEAVIDEIEAGKRTSVDAEPRPLRHMREYTSFLAPRLGFTSDTMTLLATVGRNMLLNWLLLVPLYAAALCVPILLMLLLTCKQLSWAGFIGVFTSAPPAWIANSSPYYTEWLCLACAFAGVTLAACNLPANKRQFAGWPNRITGLLLTTSVFCCLTVLAQPRQVAEGDWAADPHHVWYWGLKDWGALLPWMAGVGVVAALSYGSRRKLLALSGGRLAAWLGLAFVMAFVVLAFDWSHFQVATAGTLGSMWVCAMGVFSAGLGLRLARGMEGANEERLNAVKKGLRVGTDVFAFLLGTLLFAVLLRFTWLVLLPNLNVPVIALLRWLSHWQWLNKHGALNIALWPVPPGAGLTAFGAPLVFFIYLLGLATFTGFSSRSEREIDREWWARIGGLHLSIMAMWIAACGLAVYGEAIFGTFIAIVAAGAGTVGSFIAKSTKAPVKTGDSEADKKKGLGLTAVASILGAIFFVVLGAGLATANAKIVGRWSGAKGDDLWSSHPDIWLLVCLAAAGISVISALFVDSNAFSLHGMYRTRLMRAFLGASNDFRNPDVFTGFDTTDDVELCSIGDCGTIEQQHEHKLTLKKTPVFLVNAALNILATNNTAWAERKAEPFTFSQIYCGGLRVGYVPTETYAGDNGMSLATAMTVSGAAFNPNMGYHSSPVLTLLMTLFNARLGVWLPNPKNSRVGKRFAKPLFSIGPLLHEAFGMTNDTAKYVNLSDGGHFDNLGIYEAVMRRAHLIVAVDSGADEKFAFEDLGNALRKIRVDLGVSIEFQKEYRPNSGNKPGSHYCAVAQIKYVDCDHVGEDGTLVYFKPCVRGDEPCDVKSYAWAHPTFPHESTSDQFFTESQFESYRALGNHMVEAVVEEYDPKGETKGRRTREWFCEAARHHAQEQESKNESVFTTVRALFGDGLLKVTAVERGNPEVQ